MRAGEPVKKLDCYLTIVLLALILVSLAAWSTSASELGKPMTIENSRFK
jgi:hypothetical protein